jgi:hypothetical protein
MWSAISVLVVGGQVKLVGQVQGGGALEGVLLELVGAEAGVAPIAAWR